MNTAQILFIHTTSVVNPVHIIMAGNRVSKSCLMVELCFHRIVQFGCAPLYVFPALSTSSVLAIRRSLLLLIGSVALMSP